jgi:hypothetical protein
MKQQLTIYITLLISASVIAYIVNTLVKSISKKTNSDINQESYLLFKAGLFLATGYILAGLVVPFMTMWRIVENSNPQNMLSRLTEYYTIFIFIAITLLALCYAIGFILFNLFYTKAKLSFALANNNLFSVTIFISLLFLTLFISKEVLPTIIDLIIPYPQTPIYR